MMAVLVGAVGFALALTIAAISFAQLNLTQVRGSRVEARNAAEAVIHLAIAQIIEVHDYGKAGQPSAKARVDWSSPDGQAIGSLSFDPALANFSTNSLSEDVPTEGSQGRMPVHAVQLVGMGKRGGIQSKVVVVLHLPPYPYAVSSSGKFRSGGNMLVGQLADQDPTVLSGTPPDLSKLKPGNLASRASGGDAVVLQPLDTILGDVSAVGGIDRPVGSDVRGQVLPNHNVEKIPDIDLNKYQPPPAITETLDPMAVASRSDCLPLDGFHHATGDLAINQGLELNSGVLYVDGDLTVNGGIRGKGAIFCKGKVTITGGADLVSDNQVALLSGKSVSMTGSGYKSNFQGLVYTKGDLVADKMSVTGALVANGAANEGGIKLTQAAAIGVPSQDFHAGWLAEQTWRFDIASQQMVNKNTAEMTQLTARGVPTPSGGLEVKWYLGFHVNAASGTCLVRTDNYDASGQFQNTVKLVDLSDEVMLGKALNQGWQINIPVGGGGDTFVMALIVAALAKNCTALASVANTQLPLTPQQVKTAIIRGSVDLDLNTFLGLEDSLRVLMWKEVWQ